MKIKALFFSLLIFSKVVMSQTGTVGSPFTSLSQARTVTTPGSYYFNLGGTTFNTYVQAGGWLLVAIDFGGSSAANLPQVTSLTGSTRAILTPTVLSILTGIKEVRLITTDGTLDAISTKTVIIDRVRNNKTLNSGSIDNAALGAGTWIGTGVVYLNGTGSCTSLAGTSLNANIIHPCGNPSMAHWIPVNGTHGTMNTTEAASSISFGIWVRAGDAPGGMNPSLWYKSNANVTVATGVSQWNNQTINDMHLTQATTTKQPAINTTGALMINFNPSIAFDGTDDVLNTATISQALVIGGVSPNFTSSNFVIYRSPNTTGGILYNQSNGSGGTWNLGMSKSSGIIANRSIGSIPVTANDVKLQSVIGNANTSASISVNGNVSSTSLASTIGTGGNSPLWVGAQGTNAFAASHIAEIIVYPSDLSVSSTNKQRIESYLGLKYGITLPFNYIASDNSTVFWNTTTSASYSNNIAGIGKDVISGLEQKQSQSQNLGNQVIVGLGSVVASNAVNSNTITSDKQFMVLGDNNLIGWSSFSESSAPTLTNRTNRIWFSQNTNSFNQSVQLLVPVSSYSAASIDSKLVINYTDPSFPNDGSNTVVSVASTATVNAVTYYVFNLTGSQVSSNFYFTLAKNCIPTNPTITIVSSNASICTGSTATLTASGATNYTWSSGPNTSTYTISTSGVYTVTGTNSITGCSNTNTISLANSSLPVISIISSPTVICAGSSSSLSASGASTYTWVTGPSSSTKTVTTAGTYTVSGTDGNGCVNTQTVSLLASALPSVTVNSGTICSGDSYTISPSGASSYTYSGGSNIVSPVVSTNYTVVGSSTVGCVSAPSVITVNVNDKPNTYITGPNQICTGNAATLEAQFLGYATGGVVTYSAGYAIHTFTSNGTFSVTGNLPVEYLIVAGGGGGGYRHGAGGGGGGLLTGSLSATAAGYPIVIGNGGAGGNLALPDGRNGLNSSALSFTAIGGGGGGSNDGTSSGNGGSGGGAPEGKTPGTRVIGQGNNGGAGSSGFVFNHGGGGGAGGVGVSGTSTQSGNGGPGLLSNISGSAKYYAGGGGGGDHQPASALQSQGGIGGGGKGGVPGLNNPGENGVANTGGGGGGASTTSGGNSNGGNGGSGIVIIRYLLSNTGSVPSSYLWSTGATTSSITVTPTVTTTYSVVATSTAGCVGNTSVFTVSVNALPVVTAVPNPTAICIGGTSTLTAGGASTYTWTSGPTTSTNTASTAGTYTVTGTNGNGCVNTQTISLVVNALPTLTVSNGTICVGDSFTITPSGASTYAYSGGSSVVSPTTSTNYTVTGTDANSCVNTATLSLTVNVLPVVTAVANPTAICVGATSTLTAGGASTYVWTSGPSTSTNTASTAGTYTVTGTNGNGCVNTKTVSLVVNALPLVTAVANPTAICVGGTSTLTAGGASTYVWTSGPSTSTNTVNTAGTYTVTGTNSNGCVNTKTVSLLVNALPLVTAVANPTAICAGGTSTLTAGGASTYVWTSGPSTSTNTVSTVGTYTVTGTNGNGCVNTKTVSLVVNALPVVTAVANPTAICVGGTSTLTAGGASTYVWTSGPSTSTNTASTAGTYTVTGTNGNGCVNTQTVSLVVNALPVVTAVANPTAICAGGTSTLTAGGASTYVWTSGPSTSTNTVNTAGTYTVTGTNSNGCVNTQTVSLVVNALPLVTAVANPTAICVGGTSTLTAGGASSYVWTSGPSTSTNTGSTAGTYTVTGTNGNGCVNTQTVSLVVNALPVVTAVANPTAICVGGTSTLTAGGASTYVWTSGPSTSTNTVSTAGTYTVTGTNGNGCVNTKTVSLVVNALPVVTAVANPTAICVGGTSTLTAGGASTYVWTSGPSTSTNTASTAGTYTVTGTNGNGCVNTQTVSLAVNSNPTLVLGTVKNITCLGSSTGSISTLASGGASGYSYAWTSAVSSTNTATGLLAGVYTTTVTDANGCKATLTNTVAAPSTSLSASIATSTTGCGFANGTASLTATGGWNTGYTYQWQSSASTTTLGSGYAAGTYTTNVTDANGCSIVKAFTISNPTTPTVNVVASSSVICSGQTTTLTPSGAVSYTLASPSTTFTSNVAVSPITTTVYNISGTDASNCVSGLKSITVTVNTTPTVALSASSASICLGNTATVTPSGANTYTLVNTGASITTNAIVNPSSTTVYTVTGRSAAGCVSSPTVITVAVNSNPTLTSGTVKNVSCLGSSTGSISTVASGGASGYSYVWTSAVSSTNTATGLLAGVYTTTVTDVNGCKATLTNTVAAPSTSLSASVATSTTGCGLSNGTATVTAAGGWNPGYTYQWQSSVSTTTLGSGYAAGTYTTNVTDANGCSIVKTFTISNPTTPTVNIVASSSVICSGQTTTLTPSGAVSYTLTSPSTTFTSNVAVSPITTTVYNISGSDASNCVSGIKSITITVNTTPTVALSASSTSICLGNTATVTPSGANTYTLINTGASITTNTVVSPSSTTVYTVTGTSIAGCLSTPSAITVAVNSNPTLTLSTSNATICNGNSITLTALGTDTYTWTSGPNTPNYVVSPSSATVYTVVGTNTLTGCVSSISTTTISVNPTPVLTVSATALSVCSNGTVNLNVNGATTYTWSGTGISGSNVNSSNPIFAAPSSNTYVYSVIGTNTVSCPSAANTITITIIGSPNSSLVASSQNICEGGNATFSIVPQPGVTYNWLSPSVLSNTTGVYLVPSTISNVAGNYSVNVVAILGTGSNTCSTSSTGNLVVFATPTISLSQNSISVCDGEAVSMNVNNPLPSPANYNWSYNNTNGTFITIPQISLNESGTYTVTVTDVNGCENSSTVQILVKSCGYEIPVLLTPNDDGKNDAFVIKNIQLYPNCKVQIFNRWGSAIYSKVGYQNDWKGTFDLGNGGKLPAATYFILIEFNDGETKPYQGYIQIEY